MKIQSKGRNVDIDILKGIGIISVVFGHAFNTDVFYSDKIEIARRFVYTYHLAIFFFCTGYLIDKITVKNTIIRLGRQYKTLVTVCLSSFVLVPLWLKFNMIDKLNFCDTLKKIITILRFRQDGFFVGTMWFMTFMAISVTLYSILYLMFYARSKKLFYITILTSGFVGTILVLLNGIGKYYIYISMLMLPVILGGQIYKRFDKGKINAWMVIPAAIVICIMNLMGGGAN